MSRMHAMVMVDDLHCRELGVASLQALLLNLALWAPADTTAQRYHQALLLRAAEVQT